MIGTHLNRLIRQMPTLGTERLILRRLTKHDAEDMYEYSSDPEVPRFLTWTPHEDILYTRRYIKYIISQYKTGEYTDWAITLKDSGKMIGTCGFTSVDIANSKAEIGYVLHGGYRGCGYASEAVSRILEHSFDTLELNRIEARVMEGNLPSVKLLTSLGFRHEGTGIKELYVKDKFVNVMHFALCREECEVK